MFKNMGINFMHPGYIETNEFQNKDDEYEKIQKFLTEYMIFCAKKREININNLKLHFINYGKTELVFVLSEDDDYKVTLLVKQPAVTFGKVRQEADNLSLLKLRDGNVVAPIGYFSLDNQELYVTPYINQARCIASYGTWGMYIPEPFYRFESFTEEQENIVTTCMIAKLISLYDFEKEEGISSCKLGGGDFMLAKGWELQELTVENTLDNLYLIAAREKINCSFEEYIEIIKDEFSRATIHEKQENLIMNIRARVPMNLDNIENGIILGKEIIKQRKVKTL